MSSEDPKDPSLGALVTQATDQASRLARAEVELAKAEMAEKVAGAVQGVASFGAAGVLGLYAFGVLLLAAVYGLGEALDLWLSALIVALVLIVAAGVAAVVGKKKVSAATPLAPEKAIVGVQADIETVKGHHP